MRAHESQDRRTAPDLWPLVSDADMACCEDMEGLNWHLLSYQLELPDPGTKEWVLMAIQQTPGLWVSYLCRVMNCNPSVAVCGLCREYVNPRKRARAKKWQDQLTLPGLSSPYALHPPCSKRALTWLRHTIYALRDQGLVELRRETIPDDRQPRGWDWASRCYPAR